MKNPIILFTISILFALSACQRELKEQNKQQSAAPQVESSSTERVVNSSELEEPSPVKLLPVTKEPLAVEITSDDPDIIEVEEENKKPLSPPQVTPVEEITEIQDSLKAVSPNKEKTCEEILEAYKAVVNKFIKNQDIEALKIIAEWTSDIVFNQCKNDSALKAEFDKWEGILNGEE